MVMELPDPQCVGREFVRQYYTLLNEAPGYLHRFYSHNSSFVHGGVEKPGEEQPAIVGQTEIHKKILSLNFCECHAKIRQVDSQLTVNGAVLVQVVGELSNNGGPMRRFNQSFVLAPQSAKKYYVHNDIFRYQDEVFQDDEEVADTEEVQEHVIDVEPEQPDQHHNGEYVNEVSENIPSEKYYEPTAPLASNGYASAEEKISTGSFLTESTSAETVVIQSEEQALDKDNWLESNRELDEQATEKPEDEPNVLTPNTEVTVEPVDDELSSEPQLPMTWAGRAKKGTPASVGPPKPLSNTKTEVKAEQSSATPMAQRPPRVTPAEGPASGDRTFGGRGPVNRDDSSKKLQYPDNQQLFVGNLPHSMQDHELKQFFSKYGNVIDLRINKSGQSKNLPNFGFIVFENHEIVQSILAEKPIHFNGDHRLNVEEKKTRSELSGGGGGMSLGGSRPRSSFGSWGRRDMEQGRSAPGRGGFAGYRSANRARDDERGGDNSKQAIAH